MSKSFDTVLVANRGEIACRVMRTARRMGLRTVAVHSTPDAAALHAELADQAVELPGESAADTYLDIGAIVAAALATGAGAVHPGYGFLSENPDFVEACEAAGIVFVGPSAAAMRAMGLKDAAKSLMASAGVPVVPGYHGEVQEPAMLAAEADKVGYPVLIKARAGGGGKGMRRVDAPGAFDEALAGARREAAASFGDDRVLIEKCVRAPRHIEVQVFGDRQGNVVHLFERDCSVQRRHQKVIEEAPAPGMTEAVRAAMTGAAIRAAAAVDYVGAGTVEFIVDGRDGLRADGFWFMEMNTRLQVEHPVTEAVTGTDLVEWQFRIAAGEPLPLLQKEIRLRGHAIEARLYAEDVPAGFLPATGKLARLSFGTAGTARTAQTLGGADGLDANGTRVDTGVREGDTVLPFYDPMLAKIISHGKDRPTALARLVRCLSSTVVLGTISNRDLLLALCRHPDFAGAQLDTQLIDREFDALLASGGAAAASARLARLLVALLRAGAAVPTGSLVSKAGTAPIEPVSGRPGSIAARLGLFATWGAPTRRVQLLDANGDDEILTVVRTAPTDWRVNDGAGTIDFVIDPAALVRAGGGSFQAAGVRHRVQLSLEASHADLQIGEHVHRVDWPVPGSSAVVADGEASVLAPMPGRVIAIGCSVGEAVNAGQALVTLEAMKMEHSLTASMDGIVERLRVGVGDQVAQGDELLRLVEVHLAGTQDDVTQLVDGDSG